VDVRVLLKELVFPRTRVDFSFKSFNLLGTYCGQLIAVLGAGDATGDKTKPLLAKNLFLVRKTAQKKAMKKKKGRPGG
jgi:hypothetical protein